jgi:exopolysaccharide biosynthesis polyprenyl glycosylphosphotransferase
MRRGTVILNILRVPLDAALLVSAGLLTYLLRTRVLDDVRPVQFAVDLPPDEFLWLTLAVSALFLLVYAVSGLYSMRRRMTGIEEGVRVMVASAAATMVVILVIFLRAELFNSRFLVLGYWFLATLLVASGRLALRTAWRTLSLRTGIGSHRVMLIGADAVTDRLADAIGSDAGLGYRIVGRLSHPDLVPVASVIAHAGIDELVLADPNFPEDRVVGLVDFCHERHIAFTFVPNIHRTLTTHWDVDAIGHTPVVTLRRTALDGWGRVFKRVFDTVSSAAALVVLSPLFAAVALAIKWETAGPVFARLRRVSRNREFDMYKFRGMIENAEELKPLLTHLNERTDGPLFKMKDDPRVTRVGRFIRRTRIDELPQLFNVFTGELSLVGPRPHQPDEIARYEKHHRKVLAIKAGATGLAQASGSSDLPFEEEVELDTFYLENWSLALDLRIIARTALRILTDRSAV